MVLSRYAFSTEKSRRTRSRPIPGSLRLQTSTLQGNCREGRARARRVLTDEKTIGTLWSHAHVSLQRESIRGLWPPFRPPPGTALVELSLNQAGTCVLIIFSGSCR